jgi:glyoxylase-like metal-dependent hydrolase (beta-lactamase superfamily II)
LCPLSHPVLNRFAPALDVLNLVCHCLLIETNEGLVLVDTGLGVQDVRKHDRLRSTFIFQQLAKPKLDIEETAFMQIIRRGFNPKDVRHILATHFDQDHIGGIADFPEATIHVLEEEWNAATAPAPLFRRRYYDVLWKENKKIETYRTQGDRWHGFLRVQELNGIDPRIKFVALPGHTKGHAGVFIDGTTEFFFVGDSFLQEIQLKGETPLPLKVYDQAINDDPRVAQETLRKLKSLSAQRPEMKIFCSHDQKQFNRLKARTET